MKLVLGQKINHKTYGEGTVVNVDKRETNLGELYTIDFGHIIKSYIVDCKNIRETSARFNEQSITSDYFEM